MRHTAQGTIMRGSDRAAHVSKRKLPNQGGMGSMLDVRIHLCTSPTDMRKGFYRDRDGYALWYKRLETGTLRLPAARDGATHVELKASELAMLLEGIDLRSIKRRKRFSRTA